MHTLSISLSLSLINHQFTQLTQVAGETPHKPCFQHWPHLWFNHQSGQLQSLNGKRNMSHFGDPVSGAVLPPPCPLASVQKLSRRNSAVCSRAPASPPKALPTNPPARLSLCVGIIFYCHRSPAGRWSSVAAINSTHTAQDVPLPPLPPWPQHRGRGRWVGGLWAGTVDANRLETFNLRLLSTFQCLCSQV